MSHNGPNWYPSRNYVDRSGARPAGSPAGSGRHESKTGSQGPVRRLIARLRHGRNSNQGDTPGVGTPGL